MDDAPVFKKRKLKSVSRRESPYASVSASPMPSDPESDTEAPAGTSLDDLKALRKLKASQRREGIDAAKLLEGQEKTAPKKIMLSNDTGGRFGLRHVGDKDDDDERNKIVKTKHFTQQTGKLDADKHMMEYIDAELKKRKMGDGRFEEQEIVPVDPREELFKVDEAFKKKKQQDDDGSITNSVAMLTAIPEVDLGITNRLKNIQDTEQAKRALYEAQARAAAQKAKQIPLEEDTFAAQRFFRPADKSRNDVDALRDARVEAGLEEAPEENPLPPGVRLAGEPRREKATDDQVAERFTKRMMMGKKANIR